MTAEAAHPWHLSGAWLKQLVDRIKRGLSEHEIAIVAGALAYNALLAVFPALIATISIYGLATSPEAATRQVGAMSQGVPAATRQLMLGFLQGITQTSREKLSGGLAVGIVLAVWSASSGMATLVKGVQIAYDEPESRSAIRQRALALGLTFGAVVVTVVALFCIAVVPPLASRVGSAVSTLMLAGRWVVLAILVWFSLSALYKVVPRRGKPSLEGVSLGATLATLLWIGASLLFSLFVSKFGRFGATYGPLAGVIVLMIWFYLSGFLVLVGAEISAESRA